MTMHQDSTADMLLPEMMRAHHRGRLVHQSSAAPEGQQRGSHAPQAAERSGLA